MIICEGGIKSQIKRIVNKGFEISKIRMWNRQLFAFGCKVPRPGQGPCFVMHHVKCDWQGALVCFEQGFHCYGDCPVKECHHICHTPTDKYICDWQGGHCLVSVRVSLSSIFRGTNSASRPHYRNNSKAARKVNGCKNTKKMFVWMCVICKFLATANKAFTNGKTENCKRQKHCHRH